MRRLTCLAALSLAALGCAGLGGSRATPSSPTTAVGTPATRTAVAPAAPTSTLPVLATVTPAASEPSATAATTSPASTTEAQPTTAASACDVAYTQANALVCLDSAGSAHVITTLSAGRYLARPLISPDGAWVAYTVVIDENQTELWAGATSPGAAEPHRLVGADQIAGTDPALVNSPLNYQWLAASHTLLFDTRYAQAGGNPGPGEFINGDLWSADADTGTLAPLLPAGAAGTYSASPDGRLIAISRPTGFDLLNADGANYRQAVVTFPAILTYSEHGYRPQPVWSPDSSFFSAAVPSADPMAPDSSLTLYRVGADSIVQVLGSLPGNFVFGGLVAPAVAPDGQHVMYSQVTQGSNTDDLLAAATDGTGTALLDQRVGLLGFGWSPDSTRFAYAAFPAEPAAGQGQAFVTGLQPGTVQSLASGLSPISDLLWQDASTVVFLGSPTSGSPGLYRQVIGQEPRLLASNVQQPFGLDVR